MSITDTATWPPGAPAVTPTGDRGETVVAPRVVATVARRAAGEVEGVEVVNDSGLRRLFEPQGASVAISPREAAIELHLSVCWPRPVADVTAAVRRRVRDQVESLTGYEVSSVDITVDHLPAPSGRPGRRVA
jgi:uncharacterized alkaline shock family protein YloU